MQRHGGSILAAIPLWHAFMVEALKKYQPEPFTPPDPISSQKAVLNGVYAPEGEAHTILRYVERSNPEGPQPNNPESDPQYKNWEAGVAAWAKENRTDLLQGGVREPSVAITSPTETTAVSGAILVQALLQAPNVLESVRVYINGSLVYQEPAGFVYSYSLNRSLPSPALKNQNLLEVEGVMEDGKTIRDGVVFYK
jgi:hypothetical protein